MKIDGTQLNGNFGIEQKHKTKAEDALERIAAGRAINSKDAANLAISDLLTSEANALEQGTRNINDAVGMLQIADGALTSIKESTDDLKAMNVRYNSGLLNSSQKNMLVEQSKALQSSMQQTLDSANFNGRNIFTNSISVATGMDASISINTTMPDISRVRPDSNDFSDSLQKNFAVEQKVKISEPSTLQTLKDIFNSNTDKGVDISAIADKLIQDNPKATELKEYIGNITPNENNSIKLEFDDLFEVADKTSMSAAELNIEKDVNNILLSNTSSSPMETDRFIKETFRQNIFTTKLDHDGLEELHNMNSGVAVTSQGLVEKIDNIIDATRANIGAGINQLTVTADSNLVKYANIKSAESEIADTDIAKEVKEFQNLFIKNQAQLFAMSHNINFLQQRMAYLLG